MNLTLHIPPALLLQLRRRAEKENRSLSNLVVGWVRRELDFPKHVTPPEWDTPKQKAAKVRDLNRPHREELVDRGWSADWLDSLKPAQEAKLLDNGQRPGPDGTALTVMTPDETQVFREFTPAAPKPNGIVLDADIQAELDNIDFEE